MKKIKLIKVFFSIGLPFILKNIKFLLFKATAKFNCRTRLFLAIAQQRTILGGARTITVAGTANEFHTYFPPCISVHELNNLVIIISQDFRSSRLHTPFLNHL